MWVHMAGGSLPWAMPGQHFEKERQMYQKKLNGSLGSST